MCKIQCARILRFDHYALSRSSKTQFRWKVRYHRRIRVPYRIRKACPSKPRPVWVVPTTTPRQISPWGRRYVWWTIVWIVEVWNSVLRQILSPLPQSWFSGSETMDSTGSHEDYNATPLCTEADCDEIYRTSRKGRQVGRGVSVDLWYAVVDEKRTLWNIGLRDCLGTSYRHWPSDSGERDRTGWKRYW